MRIILIIELCMVFFLLCKTKDTPDILYNHYYNSKSLNVIKLGPPNYQMWDYIHMYSLRFDVPTKYALRCAYEETLYMGLDDFRYRPFIDKWRVSYAKAYGPMQVKLSTAKEMADSNISKKELSYDIQTNVYISMKYLSYLYKKYNNWTMVFSAYNRGPGRVRAVSDINQYAIRITNI